MNIKVNSDASVIVSQRPRLIERCEVENEGLWMGFDVLLGDS